MPISKRTRSRYKRVAKKMLKRGESIFVIDPRSKSVIRIRRPKLGRMKFENIDEVVEKMRKDLKEKREKFMERMEKSKDPEAIGIAKTFIDSPLDLFLEEVRIRRDILTKAVKEEDEEKIVEGYNRLNSALGRINMATKQLKKIEKKLGRYIK